MHHMNMKSESVSSSRLFRDPLRTFSSEGCNKWTESMHHMNMKSESVSSSRLFRDPLRTFSSEGCNKSGENQSCCKNLKWLPANSCAT